MARFAFKMRLKDESKIPEYEHIHVDIGNEMRAAHTRAGMRNYSIFRHGLDLFAYFEADEPETCLDRLAEEPIIHEWWDKTDHLMHMDGDKPLFVPIQEVFHMD